tara:strand:- start:173 stop:553 length:381 start_codon:yes stop_codon:yes gene_type:complete
MKDFKLFLKELKITEKEMMAWMKYQDIDNLIEIESSFYYKKKSKINGLGIFANKNFNKFDIIGAVIMDDKRTTLARWVNHSRNGNVEFVPYNNKEYSMISKICIAKRNIKKDTELKVNYRNVNKVI